MQLMVPTLMCQAMLALPVTVGFKDYKAGELCEMAYGHAIAMKAVGGVQAIVNEQETHAEAQVMLSTYGADSWFPRNHQTIGRVADYLAQATEQTRTEQ